MLCLLLSLLAPVATLAADTLDAFVARFESAFGEQDRERAIALFHWDGVGPEDRARIVAMIDRDLAAELISTTVHAPRPEANESFIARDGKRMKPNIPIEGHLLAELRDSSGLIRYSLHNFGRAGEDYRVALVRPAGPTLARLSAH